jgi:hypothetical protein
VTSQPDKLAPEEPVGHEPEPFLARWSRRKEEARREAPESIPEKAADPKAPPPELPPLDKLTIESDYRGFFHPKVSEDMRRAALKKLFADPHFNVMDGLDVYIDDYSKSEPIPAAMLASLKQAQNILKWAKEDEEERARKKLRQEEAPSVQVLEPPEAAAVLDADIVPNVADAVPVSPDSTRALTKTKT